MNTIVFYTKNQSISRFMYFLNTEKGVNEFPTLFSDITNDKWNCVIVHCVENGNHDMYVTCVSKTRFRFINLLSKSISKHCQIVYGKIKFLQIKSTFIMSNSIEIYNKHYSTMHDAK